MLLDKLLQLISAALPHELLNPFMACGGELLSQTVVLEQASDISGQGFGVTGRRQESRNFVLGKLSDATAIRRGNRAATCHRLSGWKTKALAPARADEDTTAVINPPD
jgi:hypothetical protein